MNAVSSTIYVSLSEAASRLGVSNITLGSWCNKGKIKAVKRGNRWYVSQDDVSYYEALRADTNYLSVVQTAAFLGLGVQSVRNLCQTGAVSGAIKIPGSANWHIPTQYQCDIETWKREFLPKKDACRITGENEITLSTLASTTALDKKRIPGVGVSYSIQDLETLGMVKTISTKDAAAASGRAARTVQENVQKGNLRGYKDDNGWHILEADLAAWNAGA